MQEKHRKFLYTLLITFLGQSMIVVVLLCLDLGAEF